jgi:hypothetical protein
MGFLLRCLGVCVLVTSLSGCAGFASLAQTLNDRNVQSCVYWSGFAGGGWPGVPQVQIRGVTATGGVSLKMCAGQGVGE